LENELEEKKKRKKEYLAKWDWLEKEYRKESHAARCAQQSLEKVEDELKFSNEMCTLKDRRIEELEKESAAILTTQEDKVPCIVYLLQIKLLFVRLPWCQIVLWRT
jgi:hypothetical protein